MTFAGLWESLLPIGRDPGTGGYRRFAWTQEDAACRAWNDRHPVATQLACGKTPPDDSLFVIAFGVVGSHGTVPVTLGIQLQRSGKGSAAHVTPELVHAIADYLRQ